MVLSIFIKYEQFYSKFIICLLTVKWLQVLLFNNIFLFNTIQAFAQI